MGDRKTVDVAALVKVVTSEDGKRCDFACPYRAMSGKWCILFVTKDNQARSLRKASDGTYRCKQCLDAEQLVLEDVWNAT